MSILAHLFPRRNSNYVRPAAKVRQTTPVQPVAPTVLAVLPVRDEVGKVAILTEHARPHEQTDDAERYTWHVRILEGGAESEKQGFDVLRDAQAYLSHVTTPLPTEEVPPAHYPDECPELPDSAYFTPSPDDVAWLNTVEQESGLDEWLSNAAPVDYDAMFLESGEDFLW